MALPENERLEVGREIVVYGVDPADGKQYALPIDAENGKVLVDLGATEVFNTTVDQGDAGVDPWLVSDAELLASVGAVDDASDDDPTHNGSVITWLKGIVGRLEVLANVWDSGATALRVITRGITHEVLASGQSKTNSILTVTVNGPANIEYVVVNYDAAVTADITQSITSGLGSDFDAELETISLSTAQKAVAFPSSPLHIPTGDSYVVEAPAVVDQFSSIYVVGQDES